MISSIGQIMLYVNDVEASKAFWQDQAQFKSIEPMEAQGYTAYVIAPTLDSTVKLVLQNKEVVAKLSPELDLALPSILMESQDLDATYQLFIANGIQANPIMDLGFMKVFNFSDNEGNYFAVREV